MRALRECRKGGTTLAAVVGSHSTMRKLLVASLLLTAVSLSAQDVLTIGSGSVPAGGTVQIPVSILDRSGTPLTGTSPRIGSYSFKVMFPSDRVASASFARAGVASLATAIYETTFAGVGYLSVVAVFSDTNPIAFNVDAAAPGDQIGTLTLTMQPGLSVGTVTTLQIDAPSLMLTNQSSTVRESIGDNLTLVNGSVTINTLAVPTNLVATPIGTTQVNVVWTAVAGSDHYEVWRSFNGSAFAPLGGPSTPDYLDVSVTPGITYLYRVRAVSAASELSGFSNTDAATTIAFTDSSPSIVKAVHFTELRTAVNAMRASASLAPLAADPTVGVGQIVRASHLTALRTGLDQARSVIGMPAIGYTDPALTTGVTRIKAAHVTELRNGTQ